MHLDKEYLKRVGLYVGSVLLAILAIVYVVYHLINAFSNDITFDEAQYSTVDEKIISDGYIFRDEIILYSSRDGILDSYFAEGEHVKAHSEVAAVYSNTSKDVREKILQIDKKLKILNESNAVFGDESLNTKYIDKQISEMYYLICEKLSAGDYLYASEKTDELLVLLNKREIITNKRLNYNNEIAEYEEQKHSLVNAENGVSDIVKTPYSGYYYSYTDGYEKLFSPSVLENITLEEFNSLTLSSPESFDGESGYSAGKIINEHRWYIACKADKTAAVSFNEGSVYSVLFPYEANLNVDFTLERIVSSPKDGEALLIFKTNTVPVNFSFERQQTIEIVYQKTEGVRIPSNALHMVDGQTGVYILDENVVRFIKTDIIYEGDGYYISKTDYEEEDTEVRLKEHDRIIMTGKELYDGKVVD